LRLFASKTTEDEDVVGDKKKYQKLLVGPVKRFDQRKDMFRRATSIG
jgi:hypothetical protein